MNLPHPQTVLSRAVERLFLVALVAALADVITHQALGQSGPALTTYFVLKTVVDLLNRNIPNL